MSHVVILLLWFCSGFCSSHAKVVGGSKNIFSFTVVILMASSCLPMHPNPLVLLSSNLPYDIFSAVAVVPMTMCSSSIQRTFLFCLYHQFFKRVDISPCSFWLLVMCQETHHVVAVAVVPVTMSLSSNQGLSSTFPRPWPWLGDKQPGDYHLIVAQHANWIWGRNTKAKWLVILFQIGHFSAFLA